MNREKKALDKMQYSDFHNRFERILFPPIT